MWTVLPEVLIALALAHMPPLASAGVWLRSLVAPSRRDVGRRAVA